MLVQSTPFEAAQTHAHAYKTTQVECRCSPSLTQALLYPPMRFLWELTAATLRNDVAPQQVTRVSIIERWMGDRILEFAVKQYTRIHLISFVLRKPVLWQWAHVCLFRCNMWEDKTKKKQYDTGKACGLERLYAAGLNEDWSHIAQIGHFEELLGAFSTVLISVI